MRIAAILATLFALAITSGLAQAQQTARPIKRDRVLSRAASQFDAMDANKDGTIDKTEMDAAIEVAVAKLRARMQQRFDEIDPAKSGTISKEAFVASRAKWFDEVDTNADGTLEPEELRAWNKKRRGN